MRRVILGLTVVGYLLCGNVASAADPAATCQAFKLKTVSKYDACRLKAHYKALRRESTPEFGRCSLHRFGVAEDRSEGLCTTIGDQDDIGNFVDFCTDSVAIALAGGELPLECLTCSDDLAACDGSLTSCDGNLATCQGNLSSANADLGTCNGSLSTCSGDLGSCNSSLSSCTGDLTTCEGDLGACETSESTCQGDLTSCDGDLTTCTGDEAQCQTDLATCQSQPTSGLLATGQTTAYGAGSDGDVQTGAALSYTDNGDGTITDNNTGLMWEKKDDSGGIHDKDNRYNWTLASGTAMDGPIERTFIATLNDVAGGGVSCFAGHCDWRIPNIRELHSIVSFVDGPVPPVFHQSTTCTGCTDVTLATCSCTRMVNSTNAVGNFYWSSTSSSSGTSAWGLNFSSGHTTTHSKIFQPSMVRAVRGGL